MRSYFIFISIFSVAFKGFTVLGRPAVHAETHYPVTTNHIDDQPASHQTDADPFVSAIQFYPNSDNTKDRSLESHFDRKYQSVSSQKLDNDNQNFAEGFQENFYNLINSSLEAYPAKVYADINTHEHLSERRNLAALAYEKDLDRSEDSEPYFTVQLANKSDHFSLPYNEISHFSPRQRRIVLKPFKNFGTKAHATRLNVGKTLFANTVANTMANTVANTMVNTVAGKLAHILGIKDQSHSYTEQINILNKNGGYSTNFENGQVSAPYGYAHSYSGYGQNNNAYGYDGGSQEYGPHQFGQSVYQFQPPRYEQHQYANHQYGQPQYGHPQINQPHYGFPQYDHPKYDHAHYDYRQYGHTQYGHPQYGHPQYDHAHYGYPHHSQLQNGIPQYNQLQSGHPQYNHLQNDHLQKDQLHNGHPKNSQYETGHPPQNGRIKTTIP